MDCRLCTWLTPQLPQTGSISFQIGHFIANWLHSMDEISLSHGNPRQNNPVDEMSPFHPPALMPAGHKNRQALHRTGFGPKMMKKQPLPCQTCAAKAPPALTPGGHKNRQAPRPGPGPCKMIPRYVGPT